MCKLVAMNNYPVETFEDEDTVDLDRLIIRDETLHDNVVQLEDAVVGHRIVSAEATEYGGLKITLDSGKQVFLSETNECCAYTELENFLLHPDKVDHIITGVGTTNGYTNWHIYADMGDVLELTVGWSAGTSYYAYGFYITVEEA